MKNRCPFHQDIPNLVQKVGLDNIYQYITNPDKIYLGKQGKLYTLPIVGNKAGDIYGAISGSSIQTLKDLDARDGLNYIHIDVHERKKPGTNKAVCPFEDAFFSSNGYGYKIYITTQKNLRDILEQSVNDYKDFTHAIKNTKNSLLCVILNNQENNEEFTAKLERELIRMKNDIYTRDGYMGGFVASQTLAGAARVSHIGTEQDVQTLEKGPFEKDGKPMIMTRKTHYGSSNLIKKNLFETGKTTYSERFAINFGDYGSYRNPFQILNSINSHIVTKNLEIPELLYLFQNLHKLYADFFFEGQEGDNGNFSGKITYDKNKVQLYRNENEKSGEIIMNYFYEQYLCLLSQQDQKTIYDNLKNNISEGLDMIDGIIIQCEDQYKRLITLLKDHGIEGANSKNFPQDMRKYLSGLSDIILSV